MRPLCRNGNFPTGYRLPSLLWGILIFMLPGGYHVAAQDTLQFRGQMSVWGAVTTGSELPVWLGGQYISQANYEVHTGRHMMLDAEASFNLGGSAGFSPFDSLSSEGKLKPYRAWVRFSGRQFEIRAGLQKINFGSAAMLRPLMWFDQLDPRDPLQLTDGVWGILGRVYLLNNANIWVWGLYKNKGPKTWEVGTTSPGAPEFGGRIQLPAASGEAALSWHFRMADLSLVPNQIPPTWTDIPEHRLGFDGKWDVGVGLWTEASWIHKNRDVGLVTNQHFLTLGTDYTFPLGNGLNTTFEHLMFSTGEQPFSFSENSTLSALMLGYPLGLSARITAIFYRDWNAKNQFNFLSLQKQFKHLQLYVMAFLNPDDTVLPQQSGDNQLFLGKGAQVMMVYNY